MKTKTKFLFFSIPLIILLGLSGLFAYKLQQAEVPVSLPLIGEPLPFFDLPGPKEDTPNLVSNQITDNHSYALVNVFASWCISCQIEHPLLVQLAKLNKIPIYGIAWKDNRENIGYWLDTHENPYIAIGLDTDGKTAIDLAITGSPETLLVDHKGNILARIRGPLTATNYHAEFLPFLE